MFRRASDEGLFGFQPRTGFNVSLPHTCSYDSYVSGNGCKLQLLEVREARGRSRSCRPTPTPPRTWPR